MPLICFSLVWFPSFKTDINLSKEAFLGAEQMPAESWNLTLSWQPVGSTHPLLWRVQIWGQFPDVHHMRAWPVTCPSACCPFCRLMSWLGSGDSPSCPPKGAPADASHLPRAGGPCSSPQLEGGCLPMAEQGSWGKTGVKRAQKRIPALAKKTPVVVQGLSERWDPFWGTPLKGETSLLNRLLSRGDKSFSRLVFFFFFLYLKQRASTIKEL